MQPTFSIIIPTFNRARLISRAIGSVMNQTYRDYEIIVVDDGSTDDTSRVIRQYNDDRIIYLTMPENSGPSAARNKGIKKARGKFISLLDSDDEFLPEFLEETYETLKNTDDEIGFSWTGTISLYANNSGDVIHEKIVKRLWSPGYSSRDEAYIDCLSWDPIWGTGHGVTIKAPVFETVGLLDEELSAREDVDLLIRLVKEYRFKVIPQYLVKIHHDSNIRVDGNYLNKAEAYIKIYQKHAVTINKIRDSYIFFNSFIAYNFSRAGFHIKSIYYTVNVLLKKPADLGSYKKILISLLKFITNK